MSDRDIAATFAKTMHCNCDLDNWEPERSTGHSWVCRIHKAVSISRVDAFLGQCEEEPAVHNTAERRIR